MAKVKVELNLKGINKVMTSAPVEAKLSEMGNKIAREANVQMGAHEGQDGFEANVAKKRHPWVARVYVTPVGFYAIRHNAKYNTLLKALDAGRS